VADTVAEAVREVPVAITMVSGDSAEEALTFGSAGLLNNLMGGAIHLCMSSISVEASRRLAAAHAGAGQGYVAAPVLGRPSAVSGRQVWILASGADLQVTRCLVILEALGRGVIRVGDRPELAHALKLGADALVVAMVETLSEVLAYGAKAGSPPVEYMRILNQGLFKSPLLDAFGGFIVRRDHRPNHQTLDLAAKGMELLVQAAREMEVAMPMSGPLLQQLQNAQALGLGGQDLTALAMVRRMEAGLDAPVIPEGPGPAPMGGSTYSVQDGQGTLTLDLRLTTHFEVSDSTVWAWVEGKRHPTFWRDLGEVESALSQVLFVRIQRRILLNPHAVKDLKPIFWGRARVALASGRDLTVCREAVPRLKLVLGL
jgi:3-hydroxyisobutyrate dehydrogenase-like beta-hydroxyacid dehydrogenase